MTTTAARDQYRQFSLTDDDSRCPFDVPADCMVVGCPEHPRPQRNSAVLGAATQDEAGSQ